MDFSLSREQKAIKTLMRRFFNVKVAPLAEKIDAEGKMPEELKADLKKMKIFGISFDKKYGGAGGSKLDLVLVLEELARVSSGVALFVQAHYITPTSIQYFGKEEQKMRYLPAMLSGEAIGSFAFTEASTGSDVKAITTIATAVNGGYKLNGVKRFVTNANEPGFINVFAKTGTGISSFILDKQAKGCSISKPWDKMGFHGAGLNDVYLKDVFVSKDDMLGPEGKSFNIMLQSIAMGGKLGINAILLGVGDAALEEAIKYAQEKTVHGKPIARMQTIQGLIAAAAAKLESSRWMTYCFATLVDQNSPNLGYEAALTKYYVSESIREVVHNCLQVHGAYGYIRDFKIERLYRDSRLGEIIEGASEIQKSIVGGTLLNKS